MTITIASVNVNGLRAAVKNGMHAWIAQCAPDVITLQEVRAPDELVAELMGEGWHIAHAECNQKGRAGVAVASRLPIVTSHIGANHPTHNFTGRWVQADIQVGKNKTLTVISAYVHTGDADSPERMKEKFAFFAAMKERMQALRASGNHVLLTGDLNVAHRPEDLKNWKGNLKNSGFTPEEREWMTKLTTEGGLVDVYRQLHPDTTDACYTWWSNRGQAYANNVGWRLDYHLATPATAALARSAHIYKDEKFSDHAPLSIDYEITW